MADALWRMADENPTTLSEDDFDEGETLALPVLRDMGLAMAGKKSPEDPVKHRLNLPAMLLFMYIEEFQGDFAEMAKLSIASLVPKPLLESLCEKAEKGKKKGNLSVIAGGKADKD